MAKSLQILAEATNIDTILDVLLILAIHCSENNVPILINAEEIPKVCYSLIGLHNSRFYDQIGTDV